MHLGLKVAVAVGIALQCSLAFAQDIAEPIVSDEELANASSQSQQSAGDSLETIEEWDRHLDNQLENSGGEPEQPLTPLDEFATQPIYVEPAAEQILDEAVEFTWKLAGLEALPDASNAQLIETRFNALSILAAFEGEAPALASLGVSAAEDEALLQSLLVSLGFYDAVVEADVSAEPEQKKVVVEFAVVPGIQYRLAALRFPGASPGSLPLIEESFGLQTGLPIVAEDILSAEASVAVALPQEGYPFSQTGQRDILLDDATGTADYTLPIATGELHYFGDIQTESGAVFDREHIETLRRFDSGEVYDARKLNDLRAALIQTGILANVSVEPVSNGETAEDGTPLADLLVRQEAGSTRSIAGSLGYATGQGFRAEGTWTHRNLFPPQGALIASAVAGTQEQGASLAFRRSNAGRRDRTVELGLNAFHSNFDAFDAYTGRLFGRVSYESTPLWRKKLTYAYGFEFVGSSERDFDFGLGRRDRRTFYLAALPAQVGLDRTDSILNPTKGLKLAANVSPEASLTEGSQFYARLQFDASAYKSIGDSFVLAGRFRVGSIIGIDRALLAPTRRFYGGGGGSVRGFGFQELGPRDPNNDPIGGLSTNEVGVEVRYRFGDFGVVAFVDSGQVYEESLPQFNNWRLGVGLGARYYSAFGPFRLDVATPIDRQTGESLIAVYVSIGQAF